MESAGMDYLGGEERHSQSEHRHVVYVADTEAVISYALIKRIDIDAFDMSKHREHVFSSDAQRRNIAWESTA